MMGDFNHESINWDSGNSLRQRYTQFYNLVQDCFLSQFVNDTTRGEIY